MESEPNREARRRGGCRPGPLGSGPGGSGRAESRAGRSSRDPGGARFLRRAVWTASIGLLAAAACQPDLRETAGPRIPVPNVVGSVLRNGAAAAGVKVHLLASVTEAAFDSTRTGADGSFAFDEVPAGSWILEVSGAKGAPEFDKVVYEFLLADPEDGFRAPPMDLGLQGLAMLSPEPDDTVRVPGFFSPLVFRWREPSSGSADAQVRVYRTDGEAVWYSERSTGADARWNGLANRGAGSGRPVPPGDYYWRLRLYAQGSLEATTAARGVVFEAGAP